MRSPGRRSLVPRAALLLAMSLLALPRAAAQHDLVFDFSPFEPAGVGGEA